jgi:hypothetical protein
MKLIAETPTKFKFATENGTTWEREKLTWASKSILLKDWKDARNLYIPSESDLIFFNDADYRMQVTNDRDQKDPLFISVPCRIKPGTKMILQIFNDDGSVDEHRIRKIFNW